MLKKSALRRILTATLALIIVSILYFFPNNKTFKSIVKTTNYIEVNTSPIYLIDKYNYLARTTIVSNNADEITQIKYLIEALTIDSNAKENLPKNFKAIIPKNTRVLSISLENNLLKINFSKEFLNIEKENEEKLIESIIYTLTENKNVKEIMIFIEDTKLEYLPQSQIKLPSTLTRDFGINKIYDLTDIKNISKTTIYYIGKEEDLVYYIPVTKIDNNKNNKIEIIIEELKSSPTYETNLLSYLASSVKLLNYETLENAINLTFNNEIFSDFNNKNISEEVKYSISLSLKDTIHVEEVNFLVDGKVISTFKEN